MSQSPQYRLSMNNSNSPGISTGPLTSNSSNDSGQMNLSNQHSNIPQPTTPNKITGETITTIKTALDQKNFPLLREIAGYGDDFKQLVENFTQDFVNKGKQKPVAVQQHQHHGGNIPQNVHNVGMQQHHQQQNSSGPANNMGAQVNSVQQSLPSSEMQWNSAASAVTKPVAPARPVQNLQEQKYLAAKSVADQMVKLAAMKPVKINNKQTTDESQEMDYVETEYTPVEYQSPRVRKIQQLQPSQLISTNLGQPAVHINQPPRQQQMMGQPQQQQQQQQLGQGVGSGSPAHSQVVTMGQPMQDQRQNITMAQQHQEHHQVGAMDQQGVQYQQGEQVMTTTVTQHQQQNTGMMAMNQQLQHVNMGSPNLQQQQGATNQQQKPQHSAPYAIARQNVSTTSPILQAYMEQQTQGVAQNQPMSNMPQQPGNTGFNTAALSQQQVAQYNRNSVTTMSNDQQGGNAVQTDTMYNSTNIASQQPNVMMQQQQQQQQQRDGGQRIVGGSKKTARVKKVAATAGAGRVGTGIQQDVMGGNKKMGYASQQGSVQQQNMCGGTTLVDNQNGIGYSNVPSQGQISASSMVMGQNVVEMQDNSADVNNIVGNYDNVQQVASVEVSSNNTGTVTSQICVNVPSNSLSSEDLQRHVQRALQGQGKNIMVLPSQSQRAQTNVINSSGIRQSAPRPRMTTATASSTMQGNAPQANYGMGTANLRGNTPITAQQQQVRSEQQMYSSNPHQMQQRINNKLTVQEGGIGPNVDHQTQLHLTNIANSQRQVHQHPQQQHPQQQQQTPRAQRMPMQRHQLQQQAQQYQQVHRVRHLTPGANRVMGGNMTVVSNQGQMVTNSQQMGQQQQQQQQQQQHHPSQMVQNVQLGTTQGQQQMVNNQGQMVVNQMSNQMISNQQMVNSQGQVVHNMQGNQGQMVSMGGQQSGQVVSNMQMGNQQGIMASNVPMGSQVQMALTAQMSSNQVHMSMGNNTNNPANTQQHMSMNNSHSSMVNTTQMLGNNSQLINPGQQQGMMRQQQVQGSSLIRQNVQGQQQMVMKPGGSVHVQVNTPSQQHQIAAGTRVTGHQQQFLKSIQQPQEQQQQMYSSYPQHNDNTSSQVLHQPQQQQQQQQYHHQQPNTPQQGQQQHIHTPNSAQQLPPGTPLNHQQPTSNISNEPNILPLPSEAGGGGSNSPVPQNIPNVPSAGSQPLVEGQEYLIQYSNGKKVIGIWDGKFFKVRGNTDTLSDENLQQQMGGTATPANTQASQMLPSGDAQALMGAGSVADRTILKAKTNIPTGATGLNMLSMGDGQMAVGGDANANWPHNLANNLARRPLHDAAQNIPSPIPEVEVKKAPKRPPRPREEGKYAVCKNCGAYSADYDECDSCHKPIPEDAKLFQPEAGSMAKKPRLEKPGGSADGSGGTGIKMTTKLLVLQTGGTQVVDKKMFYGGNKTSMPAALIMTQTPEGMKGLAAARGGRGGKTMRGRGKGRGGANLKKSPEIETVTILSSDDEGEAGPSSADGSGVEGTPVGAGGVANLHKAGFRQRMEDESGKIMLTKKQQQQQKQQQQVASQLARNQDLKSILVQLQSRSIRIGSYRGVPADHFKLTVQGVQFTITWGEDCLQIHIGSNEITKVLCHLGDSMPCMFLDTTPSCAQRLRQALEMTPGGETYYDPQSEDDVHKRITVIFENLGELGIENYIRAIFQVMQAGNPYFNKGGNLLEEIEYQHANEILISSTPQAHLQLLHLGLGSGFADDEDEPGEGGEPMDRSRSPSPARVFTGDIIKLFTYPPPPATGGITVTNEDLFCLNDGEFLNDVIIDFYLKYINLTKLNEVQRKKTHVFSSFFYRRLTSKQAKRNGEDPCVNIQQRRHARVKTWTRHVDLFEKDFIVVPINESAHWYLALICYPGLLQPEFTTVTTASTEDSQQATAEVPSSASSSSNNNNKKGAKKQQQSAGDKGTPSTPSKAGVEKDMLDSIKEKEDPENSNASKGDTADMDETSQSGLPPQPQGKVKRQCCILIFDSLAGPSRNSVIRTLREYLQVEWDIKKKEKHGERSMDKDSVRGNSPKCPQQLNFSDCGVYVLQYVESFFEHPFRDFSIPIRGLEDWFTEETAFCKREELRQLIVALQKTLNPALEYDPAQDGCMVGGGEDEDEEAELPDLLKLNNADGSPAAATAAATAATSGSTAVTTAITNASSSQPSAQQVVSAPSSQEGDLSTPTSSQQSASQGSAVTSSSVQSVASVVSGANNRNINTTTASIITANTATSGTGTTTSSLLSSSGISSDSSTDAIVAAAIASASNISGNNSNASSAVAVNIGATGGSGSNSKVNTPVKSGGTTSSGNSPGRSGESPVSGSGGVNRSTSSSTKITTSPQKAITTSPQKAFLNLQTNNLTAEQVVAMVTKGEGKS